MNTISNNLRSKDTETLYSELAKSTNSATSIKTNRLYHSLTTDSLDILKSLTDAKRTNSFLHDVNSSSQTKSKPHITTQQLTEIGISHLSSKTSDYWKNVSQGLTDMVFHHIEDFTDEELDECIKVDIHIPQLIFRYQEQVYHSKAFHWGKKLTRLIHYLIEKDYDGSYIDLLVDYKIDLLKHNTWNGISLLQRVVERKILNPSQTHNDDNLNQESSPIDASIDFEWEKFQNFRTLGKLISNGLKDQVNKTFVNGLTILDYATSKFYNPLIVELLLCFDAQESVEGALLINILSQHLNENTFPQKKQTQDLIHYLIYYKPHLLNFSFSYQITEEQLFIKGPYASSISKQAKYFSIVKDGFGEFPTTGYPIHLAIANGNLALVESLLNTGCSPNELDKSTARKLTPLDWAVAYDAPLEMFQLLLKKGALLMKLSSSKKGIPLALGCAMKINASPFFFGTFDRRVQLLSDSLKLLQNPKKRGVRTAPLPIGKSKFDQCPKKICIDLSRPHKNN
ncbi:MAG: hypothetical protein K0S74_1247 [Chlamydiales bacterium]|jgi:hypothetical protein|nr:hypothetical protein [Chlamydiales bacterium]